MQLSPRQLAITEEWNTTDRNILISAVAGSGKTTTLMLLLSMCQYRVLFVAFNKSIQQEIQGRIDSQGLKQGLAMTMHSLGLTAIRHKGIKVKIVNNKSWDLIKKLQSKRKDLYKMINPIDFMRVNYSLIDLLDGSRIFLTDDLEELKKNLLEMDKSIIENPCLPALWQTLVELREESYIGNKIEIDFADMIYLPVKWDLEIPVYATYLMVDEGQDLNLCQHKIIDRLLSQGTIKKWIVVGDRRQAIYGFSGASSKSFDMFLDKGDVVEMPLDICYRSAQSIVKSANEVYNVMTAASEEEGIVETITDLDNIIPNSMIVCRNTNPLIEVYFQLLGMGVPCYINGSDIMANIIKFLKPFTKKTVHAANREMGYTLEDLQEDTSESGKIKTHIFKQNYNNFISLYKHMCDPMDTVEFLTERLKTLFEDKENATMLCTIHKSKGLEADVVYILQEDLIPSKFAKSKEQLKQEKNLKYVARTRAKKELYFLDLNIKED